jgi:hypothetical protein
MTTVHQAPARGGPDVIGVTLREKQIEGCKVGTHDALGRGTRCNDKDVDANGICKGLCGRRYPDAIPAIGDNSPAANEAEKASAQPAPKRGATR